MYIKKFGKYFILLFVVLSFIFLNTGCKKKDKEVKEYEIRIVYGHGFDDEVYKIKENDLLTKPELKEVELGVQEGFVDENGVEYDFSKPVKGSFTLTATWDILKYTYTFYQYDRKTIIKQETLEAGSEIVYPSDPEGPKGEGYTSVFDGWSRNDTILEQNLSFYPKFSRVYDKFEVEIYDYNYDLIEKKEVQYGDYINTPVPPEIDKEPGYYYEFVGWVNESEVLFDFDEKITNNVYLYPRMETYEIITKSLEESRISIIGDSISTYYSSTSPINSIYHGSLQYYYPIYSQDVLTVYDTWWYQMIQNTGAKLGINNSCSGTAAYGGDSTAGMSESRLSTINGKGTANIVIIFMGVNDNVNGHTVGNLEQAYDKMISYIQKNCVEKIDSYCVLPVIYLVTNSYSGYTQFYYTEERRMEFNDLFRSYKSEKDNIRILELEGVITIDNYKNYLGDGLHYNKAGMKLVADTFSKQILKDYGYDEKEESSSVNEELKVVEFIEDKKKYIYN